VQWRFEFNGKYKIERTNSEWTKDQSMTLRYQICLNFPFLSIESGSSGVLSCVFEVSRENTEAELLVEGLLLDVPVAGVRELDGV
jgi:hypothetical protein